MAADRYVPCECAEVHQAEGRLAEMLQVSNDEAMNALRAHAAATGASLTEVARAINAHRLHLAPNPPTDGAQETGTALL